MTYLCTLEAQLDRSLRNSRLIPLDRTEPSERLKGDRPDRPGRARIEGFVLEEF